MVVTDSKTKFVDKAGMDHAIDELKKLIDGLSAGNIDLSDYVTQEQLQEKLDALDINIDLSAYATKEGLQQAISNIDLSAYATTSYVDNAIANIPTSGEVNLENYYTKAEIYNKEEVNNLIPEVTNGIDGKDGFSPIATVSKSGNTATIIITDKNGTTTASISDGKDGTGGGGSSGSGREVYSIEETAIGIWIDGKTVYQRVFDLTDITSKKANGFQLYSLIASDLIIDEVIDSRLIVKNNSVTYTSSEYLATIGTQSSVTGVVNAVNSNIINRAIFHSIITSATDTVFQIYLGIYYGSIRKMYLTLKYTKLDS